MIGRRLLSALRQGGMMLLLVGCEADMTVKKSNSSTDEASAVEQPMSTLAHMRRLQTPEITKNLAGKRIMPDPVLQSGLYPYGEKFFRDGRWEGSFNTRGPMMNGGAWRVEDNQMCVVIDTKNGITVPRDSECRSVWINEKTGRVSMLPLSSWPTISDPVILSVESL